MILCLPLVGPHDVTEVNMIEIEEKLRNRLKGVNVQQTAKNYKARESHSAVTEQRREIERSFQTLRDSLNASGEEKEGTFTTP